MQGETQDIQGTVTETANMENVPTELGIIEEAPQIVLPREAEPTDADPDEKPNVVLTSRGKALPEGPVIIGRVKVMLPSEEEQRAGFYTEHASVLVGQYQQYKFKRETKGDKENVPAVSI